MTIVIHVISRSAAHSRTCLRRYRIFSGSAQDPVPGKRSPPISTHARTFVNLRQHHCSGCDAIGCYGNAGASDARCVCDVFEECKWLKCTFHVTCVRLALMQDRNQGGERGISPQKLSKTCLVVRYNNKLHFVPSPKISADVLRS